MWKTEIEYVDVESGEIIIRKDLKGGRYIKVKTNITYNGKSRKRRVEYECRRNGQQEIW